MSVVTLFESDNYRYDWDAYYGCGWYVRKSDDYCTLMNTGTEGAEEALRWENWSNRRNIRHKRKRILFDSIASEHTYEPRWDDRKKGGG